MFLKVSSLNDPEKPDTILEFWCAMLELLHTSQFLLHSAATVVIQATIAEISICPIERFSTYYL